MGIILPLPSTEIFAYCGGAAAGGWDGAMLKLAKAKHNGTWHCFNDEVRALQHRVPLQKPVCKRGSAVARPSEQLESQKC